MNFTAFIAPGSDVNAVVVQEACRFDIALISPTCRAVQVRIYFGIRARDIQQQKHESAERDQRPDPKSLGKECMIVRTLPLVRPLKIAPGRVDMKQVKPKRTMKTKAVSKNLGCDDRT